MALLALRTKVPDRASINQFPKRVHYLYGLIIIFVQAFAFFSFFVRFQLMVNVDLNIANMIQIAMPVVVASASIHNFKVLPVGFSYSSFSNDVLLL